MTAHQKAVHIKDTSSERLIAMLTTALGPDVGNLLSDEKIIELMLNQDGKLWSDRLGVGRQDTGHSISPADAERIIKLVATSTGAECNEIKASPERRTPWDREPLPGDFAACCKLSGLDDPEEGAADFHARRLCGTGNNDGTSDGFHHRGGPHQKEHPCDRRDRDR